ncbi:MAG: TIGR04255 family protein, partial [Bifidobacterium dentium]
GSTPQLRRPLPSPGPLFKLDIDSYWQPDDIPVFDPNRILAIADKLHDPVRSMFEGLITNRLRNEVLRRG